MSESEPLFDMAAARRKFNSSFDNSQAGRRKREVDLAQKVDRRTLRATGRTEQFNFRCRADVKSSIQAAANKAGISISEWLERAAESMLQRDNA